MSENSARSLQNLLEQEIDWVKDLNQVLAEEKKALESNQFEKLQSISERKQTLSNQLEESTRQRLSLLGLNENQPNEFKAAFEQYLNQLSQAEAETIQSLNKSLAELLLVCRHDNIVNGQVIARNITVKQANVEDLTTHPASDPASVTYDAKGSMKKPSGSGSSQKI